MKKIELSKNHLLDALTGYLRSLMMIENHEEIIEFKAGNNTFYLTVEKEEA